MPNYGLVHKCCCQPGGRQGWDSPEAGVCAAMRWRWCTSTGRKVMPHTGAALAAAAIAPAAAVFTLAVLCSSRAHSVNMETALS